MSNKSYKNCQPVSLLIVITGLALFISTCTRVEDPEAAKRDSLTRQLTGDISSDSLKSFVGWMEAMGTRFSLAGNHREVAMNLREKFKKMGYLNARLDSFTLDALYDGITYQQWQYNVIATLEGSTYPDSVCVVGAHYDDNLLTGDPFLADPGANDNASGVAATLEIARVLRMNNFSPRNSIEFVAFGAEELGLYGSQAYAGQAEANAKKIKLMLNNDMIAYEQSSNPTGWIVDIMDYDNSHDLRTEAEELCARYTSLGYINDNTFHRQSDSYPFFLKGYKALFFFSGTLDPLYHSLSDRTTNCNFEYSREIVKISCALLVYNNI